DVFLDPRHGRELVEHALDTDAGDRHPGDRGQQSTPERVADGVAEPRLQGLEDEPGPVLGEGLLLECRTLCDEHWDSPCLRDDAGSPAIAGSAPSPITVTPAI